MDCRCIGRTRYALQVKSGGAGDIAAAPQALHLHRRFPSERRRRGQVETLPAAVWAIVTRPSLAHPSSTR
ncbi:unnamed protein product, partial [Mycena citricolor]